MTDLSKMSNADLIGLWNNRRTGGPPVRVPRGEVADELARRLAAAEAVVSKLPRTADGVPIYACDQLFQIIDIGDEEGEEQQVVESHFKPHDHAFVSGRGESYCGPVDARRFYSTREAAERARAGAGR